MFKTWNKKPLWQGTAEGSPAPQPSLIAGADTLPADDTTQTPAPEAEDAPHPLEAAFAPLTAETMAEALPEGFALPEDAQASVLEAINAGTTRAEVAKNLLSLYKAEVDKFTAASTETWDKVQQSWQEEIRSDPDFAGDKLAPALARAKETALQLGGKELLDLLDATGMGNNRVALRAFLKASELIPKEGQPVGGRPSTAPKSLADKLFPTT